MARQRMVRPEFFDSDSLAECSYAARLAFIGLWCFSDDHGHAKASVRKLRKKVFPNEDMTDDEFEGYLSELESVGCIKHYEVEGEGYIEVVNFDVYQTVRHPSKTTIPEPPKGLSDTKVTHHFLPFVEAVGESYAIPTVALREQCGNGSPHTGLTLKNERTKEESILTTSKILSPPRSAESPEAAVENLEGADAEIEEWQERMEKDDEPEEQKLPHCPLCDSVMSFFTVYDEDRTRCHECPTCGPVPFTKAVWR